ncbi:MAG: 4-amino-4-deoxy-L-arabinose transferase-like glycosyltransferase [Limisphaerales bacterium]|jgi:4-amino-4-deoxy-L-arabinose transferase-like glycosyltransferase
MVRNKNKNSNSARDNLLLLLVGLCAFIPFLGRVHLFDWDEINFAEISREMLELGDYFRIYVNYEPFWEKPPLFFWLQAASMAVFGVGEFGARFPNAIAGVATLLVIYNVGSFISGRRMGLLWALAWFGSLFPHLYMKTGIIDPWFNLFMFLGTWGVIRTLWIVDGTIGHQGKISGSPFRWALFGGFFTGLAILTKGPVGLLIPLLTIGIYYLLTRFKYLKEWKLALIWIAASVLTCGLWFVPEILAHGTWFSKEFLSYQVRLFSTEDAGHGGFPGYHFVVVFIGCFPASVFTLKNIYKRQTKHDNEHDFRKWMLIMLAVVLVLFSIVESKIIHYSSLAWFPVTWLAASEMNALISKKSTWSTFLNWSVIFTSLLWIAASCILVWAGMNPVQISSFVDDPFILARLKAPVSWTITDLWPALFLTVSVITSLYYLNRSKTARGIIILFVGSAIFLQASAFLFAPKIEEYTQGPAIRFYQSLQEEIAEEEVYILVSGHKSYAPYFFTRKPVPSDFDPDKIAEHAQSEQSKAGLNSFNRSATSTQLIFEPISRDVWIIARPENMDYLQQYPELKLIKEEFGFYFILREATLPPQ